jgi:hypothetical protein
MGTEALWIPAVLSAVGAGVQAHETDQTAKRADETAAQGIRLQNDQQRLADSRVAQEVNKLQGSTPEDSERRATDAFMEQLKRTRSQAHGEDTLGATSSAYNADSAKAGADIDQYGKNRASVLGRINAPGLQRTAENVSRSRAGTDLGLISRAANADQFLTQLRLQGNHANPWAMAAGQVIGSVGSGMASSGGYGSSGPTKVPKGGVKFYDAPVSADNPWAVGGGFGGGMHA